MVAICGGTSVFVATRIEDEFKLTPEALEKAITRQDQMVHVQLAVQSVRRRLFAKRNSRR